MSTHARSVAATAALPARTFSTALALVLVAVTSVSALLVPTRAAAQIETGDSTMVASGQSTIPSNPIAWRVVRDTAQAQGDAPFLERALGFVIADSGDLTITGDGIGPTIEVDAGDAAFIPEAAIQQHAVPAGKSLPYLRIGLVPPVDADYTAGGELVYAGDGFAAPTGERELLLMRHPLAAGDDLVLADFGVPSLVVVTHGAVEIAHEPGGTDTLGEGEALAVSGEPTVTATGPGKTVVYVAIIGGSHPMAPTAGGVGTASIDVYAIQCPIGTSFAVGQEDELFGACFDTARPASEFVVAAGGQELAQATANGAGFATLPFAVAGPTQVTLGAFYLGAEGWVYCTNAGVEVFAGHGAVTGQGLLVITLTVAPGDEIRCDWYFG